MNLKKQIRMRTALGRRAHDVEMWRKAATQDKRDEARFLAKAELAERECAILRKKLNITGV